MLLVVFQFVASIVKAFFSPQSSGGLPGAQKMTYASSHVLHFPLVCDVLFRF